MIPRGRLLYQDLELTYLGQGDGVGWPDFGLEWAMKYRLLIKVLRSSRPPNQSVKTDLI